MTQPRDLADDLDAIARDIPQESGGFAELRRLIGLLPNPLAPLIPGSQAQELGDPAESMGGDGLGGPVSGVMSGALPGTQPGTDEALNSQVLTDFFTAAITSTKGVTSSWLRFLSNRVYNGDFASGAILDSERILGFQTGTGSTIADYLASLRTQLPYWVIAEASGGAVLTRVTDPLASGGVAVRMAFESAGVIRIYQDIPIAPGQKYVWRYGWRYAAPAGAFTFNEYVGFRDINHAEIDRFNNGLIYGPGTVAAYLDTTRISATTAPQTASYMRIEVEISGNELSGQVFFSDMKVTDGTGIFAVLSGPSPVITKFLLPGPTNYIIPANLVYVDVECIGGGGAGAGCVLTAAAQGSGGAHGAGGGYSRGIIPAASLGLVGAAIAVVAGAGGVAGAAGAAGTAGGNSSFGGFLTATGGGFGNIGVAGATGVVGGGAGGLGAGAFADVTVQGGSGGNAQWITAIPILTGSPGGTPLGMPTRFGANITGAAGSAGHVYGAGGEGATNGPGLAARQGGGGAPGVVIVREYYGP